jgi:plasmid stabilization system protein ParE
VQNEVFAVEVTAEALSELLGIAYWIQIDSPQNAELVYDRVIAAVSSLREMPRRYSRYVRVEQASVEYRALVVPPCRVIYSISDNRVRVVSVKHYAANTLPFLPE